MCASSPAIAGGGGIPLDVVAEGHVFIDVDGDGVFSQGDAAVSETVVAAGTAAHTVTDNDGYYKLAVPRGETVVWVRTNDAFQPGSAWARAPASGNGTVDIALVPAAGGAARFVVASDTHAGYGTLGDAELASAIDQLTPAAASALFVAITGDLSQNTDRGQLEVLAASMNDVPAPFVAVPGNHDWYDGGAAYADVFGPHSYSFDAGGVHFVVLNDDSPLAHREAFLAWDTALVTDGRLVVAFMHAPPRPDVIAVLEGAGVDYLFTGHLHANRMFAHDSMIELNTQPLALGGIDQTPAGYRVVSLTELDTLRVEHVAIEEGTPGAAPVDDRPAELVADVPAWPQLQGGPRNLGRTGAPLEPPLVVAWERNVGANLHGGSPVLDGGRLFVSLVDLDDHADGGVVALDALTGDELWRYTTGFAVRSAPAVDDGVVVIAASDGTVHAVDAATGAPTWRYALGEGAEPRLRGMYASPTIADGVVYAGISRELVALDLATGVPLWSNPLSDGNTWYGSYASPAVASGLVLAEHGNGGAGLQAWDAATGELVWSTSSSIAVGMQASPVVDDSTVMVSNEYTTVTVLDLLTGRPIWRRRIDDGGFANGYGSLATPAYHDGVLYVPTQFGRLFAIDAVSAAELWRVEASPALLRASTNRPAVSTFSAAPVIAGDLLWVGGADGRLQAIDLQTGEAVWQRDLGAPIMTGLVPAPPMLYAGTFDGVVHAFAPPAPLPAADDEHDPSDSRGGLGAGCGCRTGGAGSGAAWALAAIAAALVRRRRRL
jgi:MYXO-CTERM domain-containing protein